MESKKESCRICGEETVSLFSKKQLGKYAVHYFKCKNCLSAQTETPYWLEEAYKGFTFELDTGMVRRAISSSLLTLALAYECQFTKEALCIDVGGGTGLLTRRLRDFGLNAFWNDKYAKNIFAIGFEKELSKANSPTLLTAFEVFEHFSCPQEEIGKLLELSPDYLLFSTKLYQGQQEDWWYFLSDGQHVQFYSEKGLALLAKQWNYHFQTDGSTFHLFYRSSLPSRIFKRLQKLLPKIEKKSLNTWGSRCEEDHLVMKKKGWDSII